MPYTPFVLAAIVLGAFGLVLIGAGLASLVRLRVGRFTVRTLVGLLLLALGTLAGGLALGVQGYHALTREDVAARSEEHTSELQSPCNLVCRLLLEKKKIQQITYERIAIINS